MNTLYYGGINPSDAFGATSLAKGGNESTFPPSQGPEGPVPGMSEGQGGLS